MWRLKVYFISATNTQSVVVYNEVQHNTGILLPHSPPQWKDKKEKNMF